MPKYKKLKVDATLFKIPAWFLMYMPIKVPYDKIFDEAKKAGYTHKVDTKLGILEKGASFGKGFIAIEIEPVNTDDKRVIKLEGDFLGYDHLGPYSKIGEAFGIIMKDNPNTKEFYSCYLNSPQKVKAEELSTLILFR